MCYISDQSSDEYLRGTFTKTARFSYRLVLQQICFTHSMQFFKGYKMVQLAFINPTFVNLKYKNNEENTYT